MKICFVTTVPITIKAFILPTAEYLHEHTDWDISFICDYDSDFADFLPSYVHYYPVSMKRGISIAGIKAMLEMRKIFEREKFDLIQYSTPNASLYASMAGKSAHVPIRLYCQWGMAFVGFSGLKRKIFKLEEKLVCSLSTWIEPDSKSNLDFAHKESLYPENKGSVIWNGSACGVNLKKFNILQKEQYHKEIRNQLNIPEDTFVYAFVGRITRDKGINELLAAFRNVSNSESDVCLLMVGEAENEDTLDSELYEWSIKCDKIKYVGSTNVVEKYLSASDCYILPSYREGFGMGVIEAESMGVPVIVTDIPGPTDAMIKDKTGLVVKKKDIHSLEKAMIEIYDNKEKCRDFGKAAYDFAVSNFEQTKLFEYILEDRKKLLGE